MRGILLAVLGLALTHGADGAVPTDEESEIALMNTRPAYSMHLEPMGLESYTGLYECVVAFEALNSLVPSEHWCIRTGDKGYELQSWRGHSNRPPEPDDPKAPDDESKLPPDPRRKWDVHVQPIHKDLANDLRQLWLQAVLQSRYSPANMSGLDGVTFVFTVKRYAIDEQLSAGSWTPQGDYPPLWMGDLGDRVFQASRAEPVDSEALRRDVAGVKKKVEAYYDSETGRQGVRPSLYYALGATALLLASAITWRRRHAI